jgi:histone H2A
MIKVCLSWIFFFFFGNNSFFFSLTKTTTKREEMDPSTGTNTETAAATVTAAPVVEQVTVASQPADSAAPAAPQVQNVAASEPAPSVGAPQTTSELNQTAPSSEQSTLSHETLGQAPVATEPVKHTKTKSSRKNSVSQSSRAGLSFPVGRIGRLLRKAHRGPVSAGSAVYLSAVMEYMAAEVLEAAGSIAKVRKRGRIDNRSVFFALQSDAELQKLYFDLGAPTVPASGVIPNPKLWTKRQKVDENSKKKAKH